MEIIPVIGLLLVIFFSGSEKVQANTEKRPHTPSWISKAYPQKPAPDLTLTRNPTDTSQPELDYQAILSFIQTTYPKTSQDDAKEIAKNLVEYGQKHQLDPKLAAALIARESSFNKRAISATGAKGLGQIKDFNFESLQINDPFDIQENVQGTITYITRMMGVWKDNSNKVQLALGSYYKGHNAIKRDNNRLDFTTQTYVSDILKSYESIAKIKDTLTQKYP